MSSVHEQLKSLQASFEKYQSNLVSLRQSASFEDKKDPGNASQVLKANLAAGQIFRLFVGSLLFLRFLCLSFVCLG